MEELEYIRNNYGKTKAQNIADHLGISIHRVYNLAKKHNLTRKLNPVFDLSEVQEQIMLSGKLGDGNFKKNGSNYYYRETHSVRESDYLIWKYEQMKDTTTGKTYHHDRRAETQTDQISFQTRNSPSFAKYVEMSVVDTIEQLNELGIVLWCLDDGWCRIYAHSFGYMISVASFTDSEALTMVSRLEDVLNISSTYLKSGGGVISINYKESPKLLSAILRNLPSDMDILNNKFKHFVK